MIEVSIHKKLLDAATEGDFRTVESLVNNSKALLNIKPALFHAVEHQHVRVAQFLTSAGASFVDEPFSVFSQNFGPVPFRKLASRLDRNRYPQLYDNYANIRNVNGEYFDLVQNGGVGKLKKFLNIYGYFNPYIKNAQGKTALLVAVENGQANMFKYLVSSDKADDTIEDVVLLTSEVSACLSFAARHNDLFAAQYAIKQRIANNEDINKALAIAFEQSHFDMAFYLISQGACVTTNPQQLNDITRRVLIKIKQSWFADNYTQILRHCFNAIALIPDYAFDKEVIESCERQLSDLSDSKTFEFSQKEGVELVKIKRLPNLTKEVVMEDTKEAQLSRLKRKLWEQTEDMHDYAALLTELATRKPEDIQVVLDSKNAQEESLCDVLKKTGAHLKSIDEKLEQHRLEMATEESAVSHPFRYVNATAASSPKSTAVLIGPPKSLNVRSRTNTKDKIEDSTSSDSDDSVEKRVGEKVYGRTVKMGMKYPNE